MSTTARYDGYADWYDTEFQPERPTETWETLVRLLGEPTGTLIDIGCGTGAYSVGLAELGWDVTGVDLSADMLRRAGERGVRTVEADATALPFADASFDAAASVFTHTDFDDFAGAVREIARVLRPEAPFVYVGAHPCWVGPHSNYDAERGYPVFHPGWYRTVDRYMQAPGVFRETGVRIRVGAVHIPLGLLVQTFLDAGFRLEHFEEPDGREYAYSLAMRWRR
jgi:SAM-dependent methyltransferase